ncbi:MAG: DUF1684 domain-containing protein [Pyrinomonadaceae bacterium]
MKIAFFTILILLSTAFAAQAQATYYGTNDIKIFREGREKDFRNKDVTPLLAEDFQNFKGLNYYEVDKNYLVKAKFTKTQDEKYFLMPTSSGRSAKYMKIGVLTFKLGEKEFSLAAYQSEKILTDAKWKDLYGNSIFIPFKDLTNGKETYGAGRYIYLMTPKGEETTIDFNMAFNPSCAYGSEEFSCPIPPKENFLQAEIKAGEKAFEYSGKKVIQDSKSKIQN